MTEHTVIVVVIRGLVYWPRRVTFACPLSAPRSFGPLFYLGPRALRKDFQEQPVSLPLPPTTLRMRAGQSGWRFRWQAQCMLS